MSLLGKLREDRLAAEAPADPWRAPLHRVRGKVEIRWLQERLSSQTVLDMLEVLPSACRTAGTYRRLAEN